MRYLRFPPPDGNVYLPTGSRRDLLAGLALWSASRRRARVFLGAYRVLGLMLPLRLLPGRRVDWTPPMPQQSFRDHMSIWDEWFGSGTTMVPYLPTQSGRLGFAALIVKNGDAIGFVKCHPGPAHSRLSEVHSRLRLASSFQAPSLVGIHHSAGWTSVGFESLPGGTHKPFVSGPIQVITTEISELLDDVIEPVQPGWKAMHGDLGPWNIRHLRNGQVVIFDWDAVGSAPEGADELFWTAAVRSLNLGAREISHGVEEAERYWLKVIPDRFASTDRDQKLARGMLSYLETLQAARDR